MRQVYSGEKVHAKIWTDHVEEAAMKQIDDLCKLPFIHKHISIMPDVHCGYGSTVGSVIPTKGAIIPTSRQNKPVISTEKINTGEGHTGKQ